MMDVPPPEELYPGVARITLGTPEPLTPVRMRVRPPSPFLEEFSCPAPCPIDAEAIRARRTGRGMVVEIPLAEDEEIYGFGLQFQSHPQRGKKKTIRVNSDPVADTGDSHAPAPFYVSTRGYGVLVDTARYAAFWIGSAKAKPGEDGGRTPENSGGGASESRSAEELYTTRAMAMTSPVTVEIRDVDGVDVYLFWGESLREAVQRYVLFSGGGCLPPKWGLGIWYRCRSDFDQEQVIAFADRFREERIPCDVLGLEPGWQTHSYPCSFVWSDRFPEPGPTVNALVERGYRLNLWTHVFVHPSSPVYEPMRPLSGDYTAFGGLVPDLALPEARRILAEQHGRDHVDLGVSGYKLDECDNSDFIWRAWSFPEITAFPTGLDGERMHSLLGILYQETIEGIFRERDRRTYCSVRSSYALSAPYPFVLYSDLYGHKQFIRGLVNAGFTGHLWSPEVRHADSAEDLLRRLQTVVFSPQALVNAWYIKNPPWKQWHGDENNADVLAEGYEAVQDAVRRLFDLRMRLVPYLYASFARYWREGIPPFRALVMDYPDDPEVRKIDDQYMMGEFLLVAPVIPGQTSRRVYLPEGEWVDFWTGEVTAGGQWIEREAELEVIPLWVKSGALLPLAEPTLHAGDPAARNLTVRVYGDGRLRAMLFEDDGETYAYERGEYNRLRLTWDEAMGAGKAEREGSAAVPAYQVQEWDRIWKEEI